MARSRSNSARLPRNRARERAKACAVGDFEKGFYVAVVSFAVVLTALLARGADYSANDHPVSVIERAGGVGRNPVYGRAMLLAAKYDSRPYWHNPKLTVGAPA